MGTLRDIFEKLTGRKRERRRDRKRRERQAKYPLFCPVCGRGSKSFAVYGQRRRPNARCPRCGAMERHRFARLLLERREELWGQSTKRMVHFAPEPGLSEWFRKRLGKGYMTANLDGSGVDMSLDLTALGLTDGCLDALYCSHILEHITEDRQAMRELRCVLRPGGWALISVPIMAETTLEDPSVTDPAERLRLYKQEDHVRIYGRDFPDRLVEAGFSVQVFWPKDVATEDEREKMALTRACGEIFIARNPLPGTAAGIETITSNI